MNADQFQRVMQIFDEACALSAAARESFLDQACGSDPGLRAQVVAMLAADRGEAREVSPVGGGAALLAAQLADLPTAADRRVIHSPDSPPVLLGDYRIVRVIGEGGMGVVYEAEQASPRRCVALKAIRPGAESQQMLRRFRQEAELLGRLQHPGIAQIYEADSIDAAHPSQAYFAMELVDGLRLTESGQPHSNSLDWCDPRLGSMARVCRRALGAKNKDLRENAVALLTEYAEKHRLAVQQRIELLCLVCDAVQHAHERGVIHRDLKPSNILVVHRSPLVEGSGASGRRFCGDGLSSVRSIRCTAASGATEDSRFRRRAVALRRCGDHLADGGRRTHRHSHLYESRANRRRSARGRHAQRCLRARRHFA